MELGGWRAQWEGDISKMSKETKDARSKSPKSEPKSNNSFHGESIDNIDRYSFNCYILLSNMYSVYISQKRKIRMKSNRP